MKRDDVWEEAKIGYERERMDGLLDVHRIKIYSKKAFY